MTAEFSEEESKFFSPQERFELLSAYIDNQVTLTERRQVQKWLEKDREFKKMYLQLLQLEHSIKNIPIGEVTRAEDICTKVFAKIDEQRRNKQISLTLSLGCLAILGLIFYVPKQFSPLLSRESTISYSRGRSSSKGRLRPHTNLASTEKAFELKENESLTIALNRPIIQLPSSRLWAQPPNGSHAQNSALK